MSNFVKDLEQDVGNFSNQADGQQGGGLNNDKQSSGNFGGNDSQSRDAQQTGGFGDNDGQQSGNSQQQGSSDGKSSGGFMSNMENTGKDAMIDQQVNNFMNKEGIPSGVDGFVDNEVNQEFNKYT
ncbi:hypothetical protein EJ03DRAFT_382346 [Teratosphaeria nubilosa]|uniref:Uncharacterized protein n=1 Tax=Teratosphaeria nubilosa TaxID=161662 RepID=A0A6G1LAX0_9PEZI|nr:hypothetical protein EJ03DRAFT_382346 [Teratosphaeria nubilosa]